MNAIKELMDRFWVTKREDKDLYFKIRNNMDSVSKFAGEYAGWQLISNDKLIKLEKTPVNAKTYMGITVFQSIDDYVFLCAMLIFLEDLEDNEAFLLSEMIGQIEIILGDFIKPDWTVYTTRKSLVRMMQYAQKMNLIISHEGDIEKVAGDIGQEVLYENTGYSRYFSNIFRRDIFEYNSFKDFEEETSNIVNTDRGHFRVNRVYKMLSLEPVLYFDEIGDDADYIKAQRHTISKYILDFFGTRLDVHKDCAFMLFEEDEPFGEIFPKNTGAVLNDIVLIMCGKCRKYVKDRLDAVENLEEVEQASILISEEEFEKLVKELYDEYGSAWSKEYREKSVDRLKAEILEYMESWRMLYNKSGMIVLKPAAFKFSGHYPKDFNPLDLEGWEKTQAEGYIKSKKTTKSKSNKTKKEKTDDGQMSFLDLLG